MFNLTKASILRLAILLVSTAKSAAFLLFSPRASGGRGRSLVSFGQTSQIALAGTRLASCRQDKVSLVGSYHTPVDVHHACQERHRVLVRLVQGRQNPTKEVAIVQDVQEETTKQDAIACLVRRSALEDLNI
ncbi:hypothetical protein THAOC_20936 [Thalassiosira oceanica]|uniref:Secreted protein n=1 Tax=Thalassiosira oceanica TaxID=159749 RepID=K0SK83_THAOC|nr:hypothetical protein THAOC_20936 [Thalassiosira oceanica]|eukprot:EJK58902.1 hypothetical protein THAOC_20936 [Thalassiosira oceanica]